MEWALQGLETYALIYLDDVLIYSLTQKQHRENVKTVLGRFQQRNMKVKWEKYEFERQDIKFLGHQVKQGRILVDSNKLSLLETWKPLLNSVRQVRQFMGFLSYYHAFIPNFSTLTAPLTELLKRKKTEVIWTEEATHAVEKTKQALFDAYQRFA